MSLIDKAFGLIGMGTKDAPQLDASQFQLDPATAKKMGASAERIEQLSVDPITGQRASTGMGQQMMLQNMQNQQGDLAKATQQSAQDALTQSSIYGGVGGAAGARIASQAANQSAIGQQGLSQGLQQDINKSIYSDLASQEDQKFQALMAMPSIYGGISDQQQKANMNMMTAQAGNQQAKQAMKSAQMGMLGDIAGMATGGLMSKFMK